MKPSITVPLLILVAITALGLAPTAAGQISVFESRWDQRVPVNLPGSGYSHPIARAGHVLERGRTTLLPGLQLTQTYLMVGGEDGSGNPITTSIAWSWDGGAWSQLATPPTGPLTRAGAAYDTSRGKLVVFGGRDAGGVTTANHLEYDDAAGTWSVISAGGPTPRVHAMMAYVPTRNEIILYGGESPTGTVLSDTWRLTGTTWTPLLISGPTPSRYGAELVWDPTRNKLALYGGSNLSNVYSDLWEFDPVSGSWSSPTLVGTPPPDLSLNAACEAPQGGVVIHGGVDAVGTIHNSSFQYSAGVWTDVTDGAQLPAGAQPRNPPGRILHAMAFSDGAGDAIAALFGGLSGPNVQSMSPIDDTWEFTQPPLINPLFPPRVRNIGFGCDSGPFLRTNTKPYNGATFTLVFHNVVPATGTLFVLSDIAAQFGQPPCVLHLLGTPALFALQVPVIGGVGVVSYTVPNLPNASLFHQGLVLGTNGSLTFSNSVQATIN